jgi:hypothetical protein
MTTIPSLPFSGQQLRDTLTVLDGAIDGKEATGTAAAAITAHLAAVDPHPTYLTQTEAGALYAPLASVHDPVTLGATVADVLGLTGQQLTADDPGAGADRLVFWDHSAGRLRYLALGPNLTITDTTIDAAGGTGPGDYPAFAAPTGFSVTGSGTASITLSFATGYSLPTTANQASWDAAAGLAATAVQTGDSRLTDAREWSAATVTQAAAEAGTETTRRAWTVQRVWQAAAAWWLSITGATGRSLAGAASPAAGRAVLELGTAAALNTGTAAGNVVTLDGSARLPAVDGSQLTNLPGGPGGGSPAGTGSELQFRSSSSAFGAVTGSSVDGSGNITLGSRFTSTVANALSSSALLLSGTWITSGGTSTTTKPAVLIEPAGTTSSGWPTAGSAFGINCPPGFTGWPFAVHQNGSLRFGIDLGNNRTHINITGGRGDFYFDRQGSGGDPRIVGLNSTSTFTFTGMNVVSVPYITSTSTSAPLFTANNESALTAFTLLMRRQGGAGVTNQIIEGGSRGGQDEENSGLEVRALARGTAPSATPTNATGSPLALLGGNAFTNATNAANGGVVTVNGGIGYGTGVAGNVVVCNLRGFFQFGREITVAQLPAASATFRRAEAVVSDASAPTIGSAVVGGGSAIAKVWCNGSQWTVIGI